ncbi:MAG: LytTR family transcriptional regulator DNA-binding domain-containing protein [Lachnospiraceae bacterium]|nr:LytTR family transcriptional regulator DNA-binding domain-containing protein [Lachnospiraceae bacterium]
MKVKVRQVSLYEDEEALISAVELTDDIKSAIDILENNCRVVPVISDSKTIMLKTDAIYYIESVDKRTYVYTKENCYETRYRLYELEDILSFYFLRVSKAMIINIRKIRAVKAELNGRMRADLLNGEQITISRAYVKELKGKLGI